MPRRDRPVDRHATLYARGDLPRPASKRRNAVATELAEIAASGSLDSVDVVHWEKRVPAEGNGGPERDLAREFRAWADAADVELAPCFDTRECYGPRTGQKRTDLVMPVLCLAVYEDDELVTVTPHREDGRTVTVTETLDELRTEETDRDREAVVRSAN